MTATVAGVHECKHHPLSLARHTEDIVSSHGPMRRSLHSQLRQSHVIADIISLRASSSLSSSLRC